MSIEYISIGELTLDDTVLDTGELHVKQPGGGALYSALGIYLWGHAVGINALVGEDYPEEILKTLRSNGIATEGIGRHTGWSLRLWILHEENNMKQQLPKLQSAEVAGLDASRPSPPDHYWAARGYHLAPATPSGQIGARDKIRKMKPDAMISLDLFVGPSVDLESYRSGAALLGIDIFSPSLYEVNALWPGENLERVLYRLEAFGLRWVAIKMDRRGCLVIDREAKIERHLPIYPVVAVDTTGAGDAFSGGFLEGIVQTDDVVEAGLRATVSASFAIADYGALGMVSANPAQAANRLAWLKSTIKGMDNLSL